MIQNNLLLKLSNPQGFLHGSPTKGNTSYLTTDLDPNQRKNYKAAGVLPITRNGNQTYVLLGKELTWPSRTHCLNFLGGKRTLTDCDAEDTASREFWEESRKIVPQDLLCNELRTSPQRKIFWASFAKYVFFIHPMREDSASFFSIDDLCEKFSQITVAEENAEMVSLHKISLEKLLNGVEANKKYKQKILLEDSNGQIIELGYLASTMLANKDLNNYLKQFICTKNPKESQILSHQLLGR